MLTNGWLRGRRWGRRELPGDLRSISIVERALSPACVLDPAGRIVAANRQLKDLLGCGIEGLSGRSIASLAYPPDADQARAAVTAVFDQGLDATRSTPAACASTTSSSSGAPLTSPWSATPGDGRRSPW